MELPTSTGFTKETRELTAEAVVITDIDEYETVYYFKRFQVGALQHESGYIRGSIPPTLLEIVSESDQSIAGTHTNTLNTDDGDIETELKTLYVYGEQIYYPLQDPETNRQAQKYILNGELIDKGDSYSKFDNPATKVEVLSCRGDDYVLDREELKDAINAGELIPVVPLVSAET